MPSSLRHPNVRLTLVRRFSDKPRFIGVISGLCGVARYCCFENSIINANTAILERVFYHAVPGGFAPPTVPTTEVVFNMLNTFKREFLKYVVRTVPVPLESYPEANYRGRKLRIYQKARDNVIGRTYGRNFGLLKTFIKHEKILLKDKRLVPRVIQPRSPEYNVSVGRYIRQLEHRVYAIIDKLWSGPTVMKGLNSAQQGMALADAWQGFGNPIAIMLDAVRFDQHVSAPMLQWEHSVYLEYFHPSYRSELNWLLSMQLLNTGVVGCSDGVLKYTVPGCRASGDMNTAMGNVLIMCGAIYSFVRSLGVRARLLNNGDDCCLIVEQGDSDRVIKALPGFFTALGFIIDIEGVAKTLELISFCQTHPVYDGTSWRMVRDPNTALSKDVTIIKNWSPKEYQVYLRELGRAGLAAYADMPVFSSFYRCLTRSKILGRVSVGLAQHVSSPILDSGLGRLSAGMHVGSTVNWQTRASFAEAFGILPAVQLYLEEYYDRLDPGSRELFPGPAVSRMF